MAGAGMLEAKIQRLKKTLSEKKQKADEKGSLEVRTFRKQLKRLQRRRRFLAAWSRRGTKPAVEKPPAPAEATEAKAGSGS